MRDKPAFIRRCLPFDCGFMADSGDASIHFVLLPKTYVRLIYSAPLVLLSNSGYVPVRASENPLPASPAP